MSNPLQQLHALGQSVWLDSITRSYLEPGGYLPALIDAGEVDGLTSNPSIFEKALGSDHTYDAQLKELHGSDPRYGFDRHKGYATRDHLDAVGRFGYSAAHRRSFRPASLFDTIE